MKKGMEEYEKAIDNGVRAADYQKETGVSKSKIFSWRKAVKSNPKIKAKHIYLW